MKNTKLIKIKRILPPISQRKKYSLEEISRVANLVKKAVQKEEAQYGKLGVAS